MSTSVDFWTSRIQPVTAKQGRIYLGHFLKWLHENGGRFKDFTPDDLVEYQKNADNGHRYDLLNLLQSWVSESNGRTGTKRTRYSLVRSFFLHNRAELPLDRSYRIHGDKPMVNGSLEPEELRRIFLNSNPCFRAAFLVMFQAGMGQAEFLWWNVNGVESVKKELAKDAQIIRVDLPGRKKDRNERNYYTFISGDALDALKQYWKTRPSDSETIFVNQFRQPLSVDGLYRYWRRHLISLGYSVKGKDGSYRSGKNVHELRDTFRSQWAKSPAKPEVAEWCMGHQIDALGYNKSPRDVDYYRSEYLKAVPYLNLLSSSTPYNLTGREEVEALRAEVTRLRAEKEETEKTGDDRVRDLEQRQREDREIIQRLMESVSRLLKRSESEA